jgi:hypothetical protein
VNAKRQTAEKTKPLSVEERKAIVANLAKTATGKAKRGLALIDFREPTPDERAIGAALEKRQIQRERSGSKKVA